MSNVKRIGFSGESAVTVVGGPVSATISVPIRGWIRRVSVFVSGEIGGFSQISLDIVESVALSGANLRLRNTLGAKPSGSYYYIDTEVDLYYEIAEDVPRSKIGNLHCLMDRNAGSANVIVRLDIENAQ
jgi:hypothetical protein